MHVTLDAHDFELEIKATYCRHVGRNHRSLAFCSSCLRPPPRPHSMSQSLRL